MFTRLDHSLPKMIRNVGGDSRNDIVMLNPLPMGELDLQALEI